jgi:hypothetical protein
MLDKDCREIIFLQPSLGKHFINFLEALLYQTNDAKMPPEHKRLVIVFSLYCTTIGNSVVPWFVISDK